MGQTRNRKTSRATAPRTSEPGIPRPWGEFLGLALLAVGALTIGGLFSFQFGDGTLMGPVGTMVASALYSVFGMTSYLLAAGVLALGIKALLGDVVDLELGESLGFTAATIAACVLLHTTFDAHRIHGYTVGGLLGELLGEVSIGLFDTLGTYIVALALLVTGLVASTPLTLDHLLYASALMGKAVVTASTYVWNVATGVVQALRREQDEDELARDDAYDVEEDDEEYEYEEVDEEEEAEDDEEYEYEEDDEEEAEDEEYEYEEDDEEYEYEEDEEAEYEDEEVEEEVAAKPTRKSKAKKSTKDKKDKASKKSKAKDKKQPATGKDSPRKNRKLDRPRELPEIVVSEPEPKAKKSEAAKTEAKKPVTNPDIEISEREDDVNEATPENGVDREPAAESTASKNRKKAPLRPQDLAARRAAAKKQKGEGVKSIPGVIRLGTGDYKLPPSKLFEAVDGAQAVEVDKGFVLEQAECIEHALAQFKIRGKVTKIHPGPVITRYEFKPEPGVKLSRIESLENDLAMALEAIRIRILAPIPGKATVGFEVPNKNREMVTIKEILDGEAFGAKRKAKLPMALGKNITGKPITIDLARAPHLLVAGATGSGKSVGVNSMICSLLHSCSPEDVRMIMIDPKMLELSIYKDIPHLLLPVITDAEQANLALRWTVDEMERRYKVLSEAQVRDIGGFNRKLPTLVKEWEAEKRALEEAAEAASKAAREEGEETLPGSMLPGVQVDAKGQMSLTTGPVSADIGECPEHMPYIVVIIDEFADLMMVASKEVEASVARIAAKARAAGIHLIVATQRPSVDVITGTIKNNFPSRIAFQVTSDVDSRTILDQKGAKQLLGMGDMLYMDRGTQPQRVHGCYVSEDEIIKVADFIKKQAKPVYNNSITEKRDNTQNREDRKVDALYDRAVQIVAEAQKVSTSMIQRRLNIGYNRAAKIVEMMEEDGVIGPSRGTTPREVFIRAA